MRSVTSLALLALLLVGACSASIVARAPEATSPWKIVEDWKLDLPAGGMQIYPVYTSVESMYVATTNNGIVCGVNTTTRALQWQQKYDDIAFVSALPATGNIFVARYSGTTVLDAATGALVWFNPNVTMAPNLGEDYNALVFDTTIVYRDESNGFIRLCAVDGTNGKKLWCDTRRTLGSPDAAFNGTFTAQLFDVNNSAYVANIDAKTGQENWFAFAERVFTGSAKWVAVLNQHTITIVNTMTGLAQSTFDVSLLSAIGNSVFVKEDLFVFTDGYYWIAALDCMTGKLAWNVTAPSQNPTRRIEMQHRGQDILVAATLSFEHTNFTRLNTLTGHSEWIVTAEPTGMSLAPVHAWLANDILYVRNTHKSWSAWGAISGQRIASGKGDLFLPRSVTQSFSRPTFSFYVTTNGGQVINLRIEHI